MSDEERKAWWSVVTQQVVAAVVTSLLIGGAGFAVSYFVLTSRVEAIENVIARHSVDIGDKADDATTLKMFADHEARLRAAEFQANQASQSLVELKTDVRWIRETLERDREKGMR